MVFLEGMTCQVDTPRPGWVRGRGRSYRRSTRLLAVALLPLAFALRPGRARHVACQWALALRFPAETLSGLTPATRAAFESARTEAFWRDGQLIGLTSGHRTAAEQARLFADAVRRYGSPRAARSRTLPPHESRHVAGTALDVRPTEGALWLERYGARYHLYRVYDNEWWHFEYHPGGRPERLPHPGVSLRHRVEPALPAQSRADPVAERPAESVRISDMDSDRFPAGGARGSADRTPRFAPIVAALGGCLLLVVAASPRYGGSGGGIADANPGGYRGGGDLRPETVIFLLVPVLATLLGLLFVRRWSYLLLAGGLLGLPTLASELWYSLHLPVVLLDATRMSAPLLLIGVLAAAQALARGGAPGWGAAAAGAAFGSQILAAALLDNTPIFLGSLVPWHVGLTVVGLAGLVAAASRYRRWDSSTALGPEQTRGWSRPRYVLAGVLAASVPLVLASISLPTIARLLGVSTSALYRHGYAVTGIAGLVGIVIAVGSASLAGIWSLAGALTATGIQLALTAPMLLVLRTLMFRSTLGWPVALLGVIAGVAAAVSRWRVPLAGGAMVLASASLFLAYAATTGDPEKLIEQQQVVIRAAARNLLAAAGTATVGATVPVLAQRGTVPAVLGPIVAALAIGGRQVLQLARRYGSDGPTDRGERAEPGPPPDHLRPRCCWSPRRRRSLALAEVLATRRADRKLTEAIRREAAEAERNRLARPIHDGVLQVLSLMQRHGPELGGRGAELADLAGSEN